VYWRAIGNVPSEDTYINNAMSIEPDPCFIKLSSTRVGLEFDRKIETFTFLALATTNVRVLSGAKNRAKLTYAEIKEGAIKMPQTLWLRLKTVSLAFVNGKLQLAVLPVIYDSRWNRILTRSGLSLAALLIVHLSFEYRTHKNYFSSARSLPRRINSRDFSKPRATPAIPSRTSVIPRKLHRN
jgi:hypothetical protein